MLPSSVCHPSVRGLRSTTKIAGFTVITYEITILIDIHFVFGHDVGGVWYPGRLHDFHRHAISVLVRFDPDDRFRCPGGHLLELFQGGQGCFACRDFRFWPTLGFPRTFRRSGAFRLVGLRPFPGGSLTAGTGPSCSRGLGLAIVSFLFSHGLLPILFGGRAWNLLPFTAVSVEQPVNEFLFHFGCFLIAQCAVLTSLGDCFQLTTNRTRIIKLALRLVFELFGNPNGAFDGAKEKSGEQSHVTPPVSSRPRNRRAPAGPTAGRGYGYALPQRQIPAPHRSLQPSLGPPEPRVL